MFFTNNHAYQKTSRKIVTARMINASADKKAIYNFQQDFKNT